MATIHLYSYTHYKSKHSVAWPGEPSHLWLENHLLRERAAMTDPTRCKWVIWPGLALFVMTLLICEPVQAGDTRRSVATDPHAAASGDLDIADVVAYLLLRECVHQSSGHVSCPDQGAFRQLELSAREDESYRRAVTEYLQRERVNRHLETITGRLFPAGQRRVMPVVSLQLDEQAGFYTQAHLLAALIRGVNELNFTVSTLRRLQVTDQRMEFLSAFTRRDGEPLFSAPLNRLKAGAEVWRFGSDPGFLRDRDAWMVNGKRVFWKPGDADLAELYTGLLARYEPDVRSY